MSVRSRLLVFLLALVASASLSAQMTGTWSGTYTLTHTSCPTAFNGTATLYATQTDGAFIAVLDIDGVYEDTCTLTPFRLALPVSGSVTGNTISGIILGPFDDPSAPFTGTITGNAMTASFTEAEATVNLALTRTSSAPSDATLSGTYAGTYSVTETLQDVSCANLPSYSFSGPLEVTLLQAGPLISGIVVLKNVKNIDQDASSNCTIIDAPDERLALMGNISGNTFTGAVISDITLPTTATVSGETITGSGTAAGISLTFSMSRIAANLAPAVLEFAADPSTVAAGEPSTLRWSVFNAAAVSIDHGVGTKAAVGTAVVSPAATTTYTLTATASNGMTTTAQTAVNVHATVQPPVILTFTSTPSAIAAGECSMLAWTTANATSVSIDNGVGSQPVNGSTQVCPAATTTYTLAATGPGGSVTRTDTITVTGQQASCVANATTLCLSNNRFSVTARWATATANGQAQAIPLTSDTGFFWFFSSTNVEVVIKVLDACSYSSTFWVFAGGMTNMNVVLTVRDTKSGAIRTYTNPINAAFQPVQDTSAFATCP